MLYYIPQNYIKCSVSHTHHSCLVWLSVINIFWPPSDENVDKNLTQITNFPRLKGLKNEVVNDLLEPPNQINVYSATIIAKVRILNFHYFFSSENVFVSRQGVLQTSKYFSEKVQ